MRIGELSRRTGVPTTSLRVWERRYGLLRPGRSAGGQRAYSEDDVRRVDEMRALLATGFPASAAARLVARGTSAAAPPDVPSTMAEDLRTATARYDEVAANAVLDAALQRFTVETVLDRLVMPFLRDLGAQWEQGAVSIGQEHFVTGVVRGRLLGLARNWGTGTGPRALLACPPGELHDLGLIGFGLALRERGWRITLLGANTPLVTVAEAAQALEPDLVVLATVDAGRLATEEEAVRALAAAVPLALGGSRDVQALAPALGARALPGSPTAAAAALTAAGTAGERVAPAA